MYAECVVSPEYIYHGNICKTTEYRYATRVKRKLTHLLGMTLNEKIINTDSFIIH